MKKGETEIREELQPVYLNSYKNGTLAEKVKEAYSLLGKCCLCARNCSANRINGEKGFCGHTDKAVISSYGPHFGEETPLVGHNGSGTIFIASCNLLCVFCQNYDISHQNSGFEMTPEKIAEIMISLEKRGCHNINLVTPSHQLPFLIDAIQIAIPKGLKAPVVWNCGGYESMKALNLLDGIVDIYMPDFKFWGKDSSRKYCQAEDYPEIARAAIKEMHRQVGNLSMDDHGIAKRGLLIRHLVMPDDVCQTENILRWIAEEISSDTYVNVMNQYRPCYKASLYREINRQLSDREYLNAVLAGKECKLRIDQEIYPRGILRILKDLL